MKDIDQIFLPKSSTNEELEKLCLKKFAPLFPEDRFILKGELIDNGVDTRNEILRYGNKLGFGFNFQLKSKEKFAVNLDGSLSKSIETSNIEYLLNNGQPAFYGFYIKESDCFYYVYLNDFIAELYKKNINWEDQRNHTIRFRKKLDEEAIKRIYNIALEEGIKQREITSRAIELGTILTGGNDRIVIDHKSLDVYDDRSIRLYIEKYGVRLINSADWNEIIQLHLKATGSVSSTSKYCMIIAVCFFYKGSFFESLPFFKKSIELGSIDKSLNGSLKKYRDYHFLITKMRLGIIDEHEFKDQLTPILNDPLIAAYQNLESIIRDIRNLPGKENDNFKIFEDRIFEVINNDKLPENIKLLYRSEYLLHLGYRFNMMHNQRMAAIMVIEGELGTSDYIVRKASLKERLEQDHYLRAELSKLIKYTKELNNTFLLCLVLINYAKIWYQHIMFSEVFSLAGTEHANSLQKEKKRILTKSLENLDTCKKYFEYIDHKDNLLVVYALQYEIYSFLENEKIAFQLGKDIIQLSGMLGSKEEIAKANTLINGGTSHEIFREFVKEQKSEEKVFEEKYDAIVKKMQRMDEKENYFEIREGNYYQIELFPIGHFMLPKQAKREVFDFLNISEDAKNQISGLFDLGIIPVVNILYNPILQEGPIDGRMKLHSQDIKLWERVFEIRSFFYNRKYYRMKK